MKQKIIDLKNKLLAIKFLRFFLSGGLSFLIDTGILISIKTIVFHGTDYRLFDTISIAKLISGTVGIIIMFGLNRLWVFTESKSSNLKKQTAKYLLVTALNLIFASILFSIFSSVLSQIFIRDYLIHLSLFVVIANLFTEATKMIVSFFAYKYFVFR